MTNPAQTETKTLDDRYGRGRSRGVDRVVLAVVGAVVAVGVVAWAVFGGWGGASSSLEFRDIAHSFPDDRSVEVVFEVTASPGQEVACAVEALNSSFATVGWKIVTLPPSEHRTRTVTQTLVTTNQSNTGTVNSCWILTDS